MIINRVWAMPNKWTFQIPPIAELLNRYVGGGKGWIDPFAGMNSPAEITNDLNPSMPTKFHLSALEFLLRLEGDNFNGALFDPPYNLSQIKECYKGIGYCEDNFQLDASFRKVKELLAPKIKSGGYILSFGWNSNGFGLERGFEIVEILLVPHGGHHADTICVVERKLQNCLFGRYEYEISAKRCSQEVMELGL